MVKTRTDMIGVWVRRFLVEHLLLERNLSRNTQRSYRDMFAQLLPRVSKDAKRSLDHLQLADLTEARVRAYLDSIERDRKCSIRTRNQRLAAIHAFARFVAERSPESIAWCMGLCAVPFKRFTRASLEYLDKPEMDAILSAPKTGRAIGRRDRALLTFMYNTGARASEVAAVTVGDVERRPDGSGSVRLSGKSSRVRHCPLWPATIDQLAEVVGRRGSTEALFLNQRGQPITRFGIYNIVRRHAGSAAKRINSINGKRVGPHTIRHTTATHLLRAGVDITTISSWLGHVCINTTNVYAEVDLESKAKLIEQCEVFQPASTKERPWREDRSLMAFLASL